MPTASVSAQEQLMMELINRGRMDPSGEAARYGISLNEGLAAGTISPAPKAPLAFDFDLGESSAKHSSWMLASNIFSHTGAGGSSPTARMQAAGYRFTGSWSSGENISWTGGTGTLDITAAVHEQHKGLFLSEGHRLNTLGDFRELGLAQEVGSFTLNGTAYKSSMITQNFAKTGTEAFITGVAYSDRDGDRFYDVGEGRSGIVFDWTGNLGGAVSTAAAGGYAVKIPTGMAGTATVTVDLGATTLRATLGMTGTNVKLDVIDGRILASSTDLTLSTNAKDGLLLGVANNDLTGNGAGNLLTGNKGSNILKGMGGNDDLRGGAGADLLIGGSGADRLSGGAGWDDFVFQTTRDSTPGARDIIADFVRGQDDIVVSKIDANAGRSGDQAFVLDTNASFSAGEVRQKVTSSGLLLEFNTDSDSTPELAVLLQGRAGLLTATDFVL